RAQRRRGSGPDMGMRTGMALRRLRPAPLVVVGTLVFALGACSGGSSHARSTTTTAAQTTTTAPTGSTARSSTTSPTGVHNLPVTDELRTQLVAAGAALHGTKPSDYNGLVAGQT